jgi:tripartite-type tricarboxylate transporter receptor subunit TctC
MHPWAALTAVAGTPPAVVEQLQRDIVAALQSPAVIAPATLAGFELTPSTAQAVRNRIAEDVALYTPLVKEGRIARM